jgi:hypothetical protein
MKTFSFFTLAATIGLTFLANASAQETLLGLDTNNNIIQVDSGLSAVGVAVGVTGLEANDNLLGIDFRPGTGQVYAIGSQNNVYTLNQTTFAATLVGNFADGVSDDPAGPGNLSGNQFAFDFNPAFTPDAAANPRGSFARIISDTGTNRVINGNTGEYLGGAKTDVFYATGDANEGADPNIQGIAYDNSFFGTTSTTQFGIDVDQNALVNVANNAGLLTTVGGLGAAFTGEVGFDISGVSGIGYATFETGGLLGAETSELYTINLDDGTASLQGGFGTLGSNIRSLTVVGAAVPEPSSLSLLALGTVAMIGRRRRR